MDELSASRVGPAWGGTRVPDPHAGARRGGLRGHRLRRFRTPHTLSTRRRPRRKGWPRAGFNRPRGQLPGGLQRRGVPNGPRGQSRVWFAASWSVPTGPGASCARGSQRRGGSQQAPGPVCARGSQRRGGSQQAPGPVARVVRRRRGGCQQAPGPVAHVVRSVVGGANRPRGQLRAWFAASWWVPTGPGASCACGSQRRGGCQQAPGPVARVVCGVPTGPVAREAAPSWCPNRPRGQLGRRLHDR